MSDARIIPVEDSPVIASTPSAPDDELNNVTPTRLARNGSKLARWAASMVGQRLVISGGEDKARRTGTAHAASRPQRVELTERSLVHADTTTWGWVTPVGRDRYTTVVVAWALRVIRAALDHLVGHHQPIKMHECEGAVNGT